MKLQILSDLHLEFYHDYGKSFVESLPKTKNTVLVLTGDTIVVSKIDQYLDIFNILSSNYTHIIYILGNHEYYHSSTKNTLPHLKSITDKINNFHILNNNIIEIKGFRFLGTTLWFKEDAFSSTYSKFLSDFQVIKDFQPWVYKHNEKSVKFIEKELKEGDILVTHHAPTSKSIASKFLHGFTKNLNRFYVTDLSDLVIDRKPQLCIHGHTHESFDYVLGESKVICNPFGYVGIEENLGFKDNLILEL